MSGLKIIINIAFSTEPHDKGCRVDVESRQPTKLAGNLNGK